MGTFRHPLMPRDHGFEWSQTEMIKLKDTFKQVLNEGKSKAYPMMFQKTFVLEKKFDFKKISKKLLAIDFGGTSLKLGLYEIRDGSCESVKDLELINIPTADQIREKNAFEWLAEQI